VGQKLGESWRALSGIESETSGQIGTAVAQSRHPSTKPLGCGLDVPVSIARSRKHSEAFAQPFGRWQLSQQVLMPGHASVLLGAVYGPGCFPCERYPPMLVDFGIHRKTYSSQAAGFVEQRRLVRCSCDRTRPLPRPFFSVIRKIKRFSD
jgi:hypothetical protein